MATIEVLLRPVAITFEAIGALEQFFCHVAILVIATQLSVALESCCYCQCRGNTMYCHTSRHCYSTELQQTATVATHCVATTNIVAIDYIATDILHCD